MIDEAIAPLAADPRLPMTPLRTRSDDPAESGDPNVVKVVVDRARRALYFSRAPIPHARDAAPQAPAAVAWRHIGLYVYRRAFLPHFAALPPTPLERAERLEQLRALEHGYRITAVETTHDSIGVDTPADLAEVDALVAAAAMESARTRGIR